MKAIVVVFAITIVAVLGELPGPTYEQKAKLREYEEFCINETGVDQSVVENAEKGQIAEGDQRLPCFFTCMLKKMEILKANGDIDWEVARAKVPSGTSQEQTDRIYDNCQNIAGNGCEKGANLLDCFADNKGPVIFA